AYFEAQAALHAEVREQRQHEVAPVEALLAGQAAIARRLEANLEARLEPLQEYADSLEAGLEEVLEQLRSEQGTHVSTNLLPHFESERARVAEIRAEIAHQRRQLERFLDAQRQMVDAALAPFDDEVESLESHLAG